MKKYLNLNYIKIMGIILAFFVAGYLFLVNAIVPEYIQQLLPVAEDMAKDYINGSVKIGGLNWNGGLSAEIENVVIKDAQQKEVAVLPKTKVHLRPWLALIKKERALSRIDLLSPQVVLRMQENDKWNMSDIMKPSKSEENPFYGVVNIENAKLKVETPYGEWKFDVAGSIDGGANPHFALETSVKTKDDEIKLSGLMTTKGIGRLQANVKKFGFVPYASLVKHYTKIEDFAGELVNTHLLWENDGKKGVASGDLELAKVAGTVKTGEEKHKFSFDCKLSAAKSIIDLKKLDVVLDDNQKLSVIGKADVHDLENIGGQGLLSSPRLSYKDYSVEKLYVPFTLSKKLMQIDKASVLYGGGEVKTSATIDLRDNSLTADVFLNNITHQLSSKVNDILKANGSMAVLGGMEKKEGKETFQIHAAADTFKLQWQDLSVNKMVLDGDFDGNNLTMDHFSAWTDEGVFALQGKAAIAKGGPLTLKGRIADFGIGPALYHFTNIVGKGMLTMNFAIGGTNTNPEFNTYVQLRDVDILQNKLKEMHGDVAMKNKILNFKRIGATQVQGRHILNGTVDFNQQEPIFDLNLESRHVRMEPIVALVSKDLKLTGNLNNKMSIKGTIKHPRVDGQMDLSDGSVQTYLLKGLSGKYLYDDGAVSLKDFLLKLFIADVSFSGTMSKNQALNFDIEANNIDVSKSPYKDPNFDINGLLDLKGHISGFVKAPYFEGKLASDKLKLNGEVYTDISGIVNSDMQKKNTFDVEFKQPHQNAKGEAMSGIGLYKASGNLDIEQKFLAGKVTISDGDIAGLLRTNKMEYAIDGYVDGTVDICPDGKGSGINYILESKNISTHNLKYDKMLLKGNFRNQVINIAEALLRENAKNIDKGYINASGTVDIAKKTLDVKAKAVAANPAIVNIAMKNPLDIKGSMNLDAGIIGSFDLPKADAKLEILNGSLMGVAFDKIGVAAEMADDNIQLKEMSATKDVYSISGKGKIPVDALRSKAERKNQNAAMDIALDLDNTELGILTAVHYVDWGSGDVKGNVSIKGTLEEPLVYGNIKVEDGTVKLHDVNPVLEHIQVALDFNGEKAELHNLFMQLGKKGSVAVKGNYSFNAPDQDAYKFNIAAKDAELEYSSMFKGKINSDIEVTPQSYRDYWHRTITAQSGSISGRNVAGAKLVQNAKLPINLGPRLRSAQYRPLIKGKLRFDDVVANILGVEDSEPGSETNLGLDMKIELGPKIHMLNAMFYDIWLSGGLDVKGGYYSQTSNNSDEDEKIIKRHDRGPDGLRIDGKIKADKGNITYLRTVFKITDAELNWTQPGEILPYVKLDSWSRFGKYRIFINIDGSLGDIKKDDILKLTSSPPLEKNTLIRMLTLQRETASGSNDLTNDDLNNVMTAGLQMAVLGNVELWIKQNLGLDQFRVYSGKVNAGIAFDGSDYKKQLTAEEKNRYNILISKYLTDKFMIGYTSDFSANEKVIFGQYDLGRHFNLTYSEKQRMDNSRRHWAGIEYRVDFK